MARGGSRPTAGRKIGSKDKVTELVEAAAATGELPHMLLLRISRGERIKHGNEDILPDFEMRVRCAEVSATYFAPKLAQVSQVIKQEVNHVISGEVLSDKQFEDKYIKNTEPD